MKESKLNYLSNSTEDAAHVVGISYVTLRRWLASGRFVPPWEMVERRGGPLRAQPEVEQWQADLAIYTR
jgi:predicted site-specific integrase-resolvase